MIGTACSGVIRVRLNKCGGRGIAVGGWKTPTPWDLASSAAGLDLNLWRTRSDQRSQGFGARQQVSIVGPTTISHTNGSATSCSVSEPSVSKCCTGNSVVCGRCLRLCTNCSLVHRGVQAAALLQLPLLFPFRLLLPSVISLSSSSHPNSGVPPTRPPVPLYLDLLLPPFSPDTILLLPTLYYTSSSALLSYYFSSTFISL